LNAFEKGKVLMEKTKKMDKRFLKVVQNYLVAYGLDDGMNTKEIFEFVSRNMVEAFPFK